MLKSTSADRMSFCMFSVYPEGHPVLNCTNHRPKDQSQTVQREKIIWSQCNVNYNGGMGEADLHKLAPTWPLLKC